MPRCRIRVRNGYQAIKAVLEDFLKEVYRYNSLLKGTGFYLKPVHIVTRRLSDGTRLRYMYIGRYWWRLSYEPKRRGGKGLRWRYVGREKPPELHGYPDPPTSPLHGLHVIVDGDDVLIDCKLYERYRWVFEGYTAEHA